MPLQTANQFQLVPDIARAGTGFLQGQQSALARQQGQRAQAQEGRAVTAEDQKQSELRRQVINQAAVNIKKLPIEQRAGALEQAGDSFRSFNIDPSVFANQPLDDATLDQVIAGTGGAPTVAGGQKFGKVTEGIGPDGKPVFFQGATGGGKARILEGITPEVEAAPVLPTSITANLSPELTKKAADTFAAAGGGDKGIKAVTKIIDQGTESERRAAAPEIIRNTFPKASDAERAQLQGAMDGAKNTESGMKAAGKLREEQRRDKKGKVFQARAVELLTGILDNDELDDVLGSVEGATDFRFQDSEAELISDIEEAANILTADNLSLMSGVLSESDIKILQNLAGGALNRKRSSPRFIKDVTALRDKLASEQIVTVDDRATQNQVQEGQFIANPSTGQRMQLVNGEFVEVQ